jgi:hypothetical protein
MISGTWDFAGLLFAISGFLLVTGPVMASLFYRQGLSSFFLRGLGQALPSDLINILGDRVFYWGCYYGVIMAGAIGLLWWRRNSTVIYNADLSTFEATFFGVLQREQIPFLRRGQRVYLTTDAVSEAMVAEQWQGSSSGREVEIHIRAGDGVNNPAMSRSPAELATPSNIATWISLDPFALLSNMTLHWHGPNAHAFRERLEPALSKALTNVVTEENAVSGWLLGISGLLFLIMIFSTALVILSTIFPVQK